MPHHILPAIKNPFRPAKQATSSQEFFGRRDEIQRAERVFPDGSILIEGGVGIGKSSFQAYLLKLLDYSSHGSQNISAQVIGDPESTLDKLASAFVTQFSEFDEDTTRSSFSFPKIISFEKSHTKLHFKPGHHIETLLHQVTAYARKLEPEGRFLILSIDEADKCIESTTQLIRKVWTYTNHQDIDNVRFVVAGVSPLLERMVRTDEGIARCFSAPFMLGPLDMDSAIKLLDTKFAEIEFELLRHGERLAFTADLHSAIASISGGHPYILQKLGHTVVDRINRDWTFDLNTNDLYEALVDIAKDRDYAYRKLYGHLVALDAADHFRNLLNACKVRFPTTIEIKTALKTIGSDQIDILVDLNIITLSRNHEYRLVDEFFWIWLKIHESKWQEITRKDVLVLSELERFGVIRTRRDIHDTINYIKRRFQHLISDSDKTSILMNYIRSHARDDAPIPVTQLIENFSSIFGGAGPIFDFLESFEKSGFLESERSPNASEYLIYGVRT